MKTSSYVRIAIDVVALMVVGAAGYVTFLAVPKYQSQDVIKVTDGYPVGAVISGKPAPFVFEFKKLRDDCHSPTLKRTFVDMENGQSWPVKDVQSDEVLQYPKSDGVDKIMRLIEVPKEAKGPTNVILSSICYRCPPLGMPLPDPQRMGSPPKEQLICRPFSTRKFEVN